MDSINQSLFLWINAPAQPNALVLTLATLLADSFVIAIPCLIAAAWLRGDERLRKVMLVATVSGLSGLLFNQFIGLLVTHPRPFMIGLGHTFVPHVADSSFPSDHLTLWWGVAFSLLLQQGLRRAWIVLALLGLPIAWARIYVGVHFPFDMVGAAMVAALAAWLTLTGVRWYLRPLFQFTSSIHLLLFSRLIAQGWVRK